MNNPEKHTDETLVVMMREENGINAFELLYSRYWKKLLTEAKFQIGSEQDAEEVVQQVFLNIWKIRKELQLQHSFHTYIAAAVKYGILAALARKKKQHTDHTVYTSTCPYANNRTHEWIDYETTRSQLEKTISDLPEKCQLVFRLSREKGYSEKQIAAELSISKKTVEAHISRALKTLRTNMPKLPCLLF